MIDVIVGKILGKDFDLMLEGFPPKSRLVWHVEW